MIEFLQAKYPHALPTLRVVTTERGERAKEAMHLTASTDGVASQASGH
jgi:hypothetical protein